MTQTTPHQADLVGLVKKLSPQDGDVFVVPETATQDFVNELSKALKLVVPGIKGTIVRGDLKLVSVSEMNDAGWYRA